MTQTELALTLHKEFGFPKSLSEKVLKTILQEIAKEVKTGGIVKLRNFGSFSLKLSRGKLRPKFKASKNLTKVSLENFP